MDKIIKIEENWIFLIKENLFTQNFAKQPYIFFGPRFFQIIF